MTMKRVDLIKTGGFAPTTNLVVVEDLLPLPLLKEGEVLIDIQATAINPIDWKICEYGVSLPPTLPASIGSDVAGVVVAAPTNSPLMGKHVVTYLGSDKSHSGTSRGAFASHVAADEDVVFEVPTTDAGGGMTPAEASSLALTGLTAIMALRALTTSQAGEWILVWGASSAVGHHVVQLATRQGYKVLAIASSQHKAMVTEDLGAAAFVDYRSKDIGVEEAVTKIVQQASDEQPIFLNGAVDCIGNPTTSATVVSLLGKLKSPDRGGIMVTTDPSGYDGDMPTGVVCVPVDVRPVLETDRDLVRTGFPQLLHLKPQAIRSIRGPVSAETVARALQTNKDGVSGEKVVIEWEKVD